MGLRRVRTAALLACAIACVPQLAFAQGADEDEVEGPPPPEATAEPADTDAAGGEAGDATAGKDGDEAALKDGSRVAPPEEIYDSKDVTEKKGKYYFFPGIRYTGTIIPQFLLNMFVDQGATIMSHTIGAEFDIRKDGFSLIPAISYTEYGTDDILFKEKGKPDTANNWSSVNSSMKAIYLTADLLWSTQVHKNVAIEYGAGFGVGTLFGGLENNWVYDDPNGALARDDGRRYSKCQTEGDDPACQKAAHSNATVAKVGGYEEPSWFNGGSKPNFFLHLAVPKLGVRIKPVKEFTARVNFGFSLTGFFFGLGVNYGLEGMLSKQPRK